jgi:hypothetical protein
MKVRQHSARFTVLTLVCTLTVMAAALAWAGCKSNCRDEYDSEVESCKLLYDDPEDADELRSCIQNAKDEYESCIEECNS